MSLVDDPRFAEALETVLRDLRAQGVVEPKIRVEQDYTMLYAPDGSGQGVSWPEHGPAADRLAWLADQVQEWAVEALWRQGAPAVWPHCPWHPNTHPLKATVEPDTDTQAQTETETESAVWVCPNTGATVARVGELKASR